MTLQKPESRLKGNTRRQSGFSLVEVLIVVVVVLVITAMAITQLQPTLQGFRANAAEAEVRGAMRTGRETAISERAPVLLTFGVDANNNATISLTQVSQTGVVAGAPFLSIPLEETVQFAVIPTVPDTPDGFGNKSALYFGGASYAPGSILEFQSDGTFTSNGLPVNGSVFMSINNIPTTARAVTVLGATGRIKAWTSNGPAWFQQ